MVSSSRMRLKVEIDIDILTDPLENNDRLLIIEDGIIEYLKVTVWRGCFISDKEISILCVIGQYV